MSIFFGPNPPVRSLFARDRVILFTLSFLSLFVELLLIRHMGSEIRIFAYFKNLTLIAAFLGLGVGYLYRPKVSLLVTLAAITLLAAASHPASGFYQISNFLNLDDFNMWEPFKANSSVPHVMIGLFLLVLLFFTILIAMVPMGQALAEIFDRSQNRIVDYSINITGAILGIWFFAWLSFEQFPPVFWYLMATAFCYLLYQWTIKGTLVIAAAAAMMAATLLTAASPEFIEDHWSPYQRISLSQVTEKYKTKSGAVNELDYYKVEVNHSFYLNLYDFSLKARERHRAIYMQSFDRYQYYDLPYTLPDKLDHVLVLGSGGGNDVAGALRAGAKKVTAVEIDPVIIDLGKKYHPEKPYQSERVTIINNDARNYLRTTDEKFDLIVLGLLDSHTLTSNFSNTNLDSFMYTIESVQDMRARLKDDGVLALSFQVSFGWVGKKLYTMVTQVFEEEPVILYRQDFSILFGPGGTYFLVGKQKGVVRAKVDQDEILSRMEKGSDEEAAIIKSADALPQTDDWPYLYVPTNRIPKLHLFVSGLLLLIFALVYGTQFGKPKTADLHFAALGAGFLLLEVAVISRFALFWGSTWLVSSIVISLILITILIANLSFIWSKGALSYPVLYGLLALFLVAVYFVPLEADWVILLYLLPFTAIGYLFAKSFAGAGNASQALGYNLFGALAGGLAESASFVTGLSALILIALGFYLLSAIFFASGKGS